MIDLKDVVGEQLPQVQKDIIKLIGLEAYVKLSETYGGLSLYINKIDSILRDSRNKEIRDAFDGNNYRQLATKYRLTEVSIRIIVAEKDREMKKSQVDGQQGFFSESLE